MKASLTLIFFPYTWAVGESRPPRFRFAPFRRNESEFTLYSQPSQTFIPTSS